MEMFDQSVIWKRLDKCIKGGFFLTIIFFVISIFFEGLREPLFIYLLSYTTISFILVLVMNYVSKEKEYITELKYWVNKRLTASVSSQDVLVIEQQFETFVNTLPKESKDDKTISFLRVKIKSTYETLTRIGL